MGDNKLVTNPTGGDEIKLVATEDVAVGMNVDEVVSEVEVDEVVSEVKVDDDDEESKDEMIEVVDEENDADDADDRTVGKDKMVDVVKEEVDAVDAFSSCLIGLVCRSFAILEGIGREEGLWMPGFAKIGI